MLGDADTPIMPDADYYRIKGKVNRQMGMLPNERLSTNYLDGLTKNFNPLVDPDASDRLISGIEKIIEKG